MRVSALIASIVLAGCGWLHAGRPPPPESPQLIVTGVPAGSVLFIDGVQARPAMDAAARSRVLEVSPGAHTVEVKFGDTVVYRESTYVGSGDKRVVTVLSGNSRN